MLDVRIPEPGSGGFPLGPGTALEVVLDMADLSIFTQDLPVPHKADAYMTQTLGILRNQGIIGPTLLLGATPEDRSRAFLALLADLGLIEVR